jgi:cytochrome o ubiquinol oxidase operon protein cyoD
MSAHSIHEEESHGSVGSYITGFFIAVILTAASFRICTNTNLSHTTSLMALVAFAIAQIFVHVVFFLHMDTSSSQRWNTTAFGFTVMTLLIVVTGTVWVMHNVAINMMSR